jgi:hypothetical protein
VEQMSDCHGYVSIFIITETATIITMSAEMNQPILHEHCKVGVSSSCGNAMIRDASPTQKFEHFR